MFLSSLSVDISPARSSPRLPDLPHLLHHQIQADEAGMQHLYFGGTVEFMRQASPAQGRKLKSKEAPQSCGPAAQASQEGWNLHTRG